MSTGLPVSQLISASVNLAQLASQVPSFNSNLILGTSTVIDTVTRLRSYTSLSGVAVDFGSACEEYYSAALWFAQSPQPGSLQIGRWCKTAASGQLVGGAVPAANQALSAWTSITTGSLKITIDTGLATNVTGLDFHLQTTMTGVASIINTALGLLTPAAGCVWDAVYQRFVITSASTGVNSAISFLSAAPTGTDISAQMAGTAALGAYQAGGLAAETALAAVTLFDTMFSSTWYGLEVPSAAQADHLAIGAFIEASSNAHFYGVTDQEAAVLTPGDTTTTAYKLKALALNHTATQYSSSSAYAASSLLGRILTTNWTDNNSAITLMYKNEPSVVAETLNDTQMAALLAKNANVFVNYNNSTAIIQPGVCASGQYADTIIGVDWLRATIMTNLYNVLYLSSTKIPQTDAGMHQLVTAMESALDQGVSNGLLAPGYWSGAGFGNLLPGQFLSKGYYIYQPPIQNQSTAQRSSRVSVPFQIAAHLAGAVHTASVTINVA